MGKYLNKPFFLKMLLESFITNSGAQLEIKEKKLIVSGGFRAVAIKGDPGLVFRAIEKATSAEVENLGSLDTEDFRAKQLNWFDDEAVEKFLATQTPVQIITASEALAKMEKNESLDNCLVRGSQVLLTAIMSDLGRGIVKDGMLHLGQTESVYQLVTSLVSGA